MNVEVSPEQLAELWFSCGVFCGLARQSGNEALEEVSLHQHRIFADLFGGSSPESDS
ncbi:MAG: hypothetical protein ABSF84_02725 [Acidimicrobiales bacterium]|jgi:hypothetical protein